jgi:hypothetical protein
MRMMKCKNCSKKIIPADGYNNTQIGIFCINCYDKKIKEAKINNQKKSWKKK